MREFAIIKDEYRGASIKNNYIQTIPKNNCIRFSHFMFKTKKNIASKPVQGSVERWWSVAGHMDYDCTGLTWRAWHSISNIKFINKNLREDKFSWAREILAKFSGFIRILTIIFNLINILRITSKVRFHEYEFTEQPWICLCHLRVKLFRMSKRNCKNVVEFLTIFFACIGKAAWGPRTVKSCNLPN